MARTRIAAALGVTQVVKVRLEPSLAQVELLSGYCGTARAIYSIRLYRLKVNLSQRESEESYGLLGEQLTPSLSGHEVSLGKLHGRVSDLRETFHQKLSSTLTESAPLMGVETLNLRPAPLASRQ